MQGILLSGMVEADRQNIAFELEHIAPMDHLSVETGDLCILLDILINNAIHWATQSPDKHIRISFYAQDGSFKISIGHTCRHTDTVHSDIRKSLYSGRIPGAKPEKPLLTPSLASLMEKYAEMDLACLQRQDQFTEILSYTPKPTL